MNTRVFGVALLLFGSGLCALVYQTVWLREFRLIFGASTAATAAVLGIFMAGLGLGSVLLGKRAERSPRPLLFYARLELAIAASAALTPFLVMLVRSLYSALGGSLVLGPTLGTVARLALSALVLAVPTLLMGGTLPAAARSVVSQDDTGRRGLALLYGINTLGAVTGALLSTFVALELLGNRLTLWSACLLNVVVAVIAALVAARISPTDETPAAPATSEPAVAVPPRFVLLAAAIVGFAFLLMELVWYRMLSPLLGGSTFTFGLILATALLGIGIGGAVYSCGARRSAGTLTAFAWTCALEGLAIAVPFALGDRLAVLAAHLRSLSAVGFGAHICGWFLVIAIVVLPAALIAGYQFPLLVALLGRGSRGVADHTARAYALNTVGAILGSLAGGFGLLPLLTAPGTWKLVSILLGALALAALVVQCRRSASSTSAAGGFPMGSAFGVTATVCLTMAMFFTLGPTAAWRHSGVGVGRSGFNATTRNAILDQMAHFRRSLLWEADGVESSVAIHASSAASFVVNGKSDGNIRTDAGTQVMGGLLGAVLLPQVRTACVIGLGTGSTAGWLAAVPEIERVDAMELEPAILTMARVCAQANLHVLENPKCHILLGDARELLLTTRARYDLIFSEPSNPYRAGIASLFTTEFYETARERLNAGGLFLQWVQAYEVEGEAIRIVLATLAGVFPHVEVWTTQTGDLLLVAAAEPRTWDAAEISARIAQEPFRTACRRVWGVDKVEGFLAHFAAGPELARAIANLPDAPRNTDDNTLLEFAFARSVGRDGGFRSPELLRTAAAVGASWPHIRGKIDWARVDEERDAMFTYHGYPPPLTGEMSEAARARCEIRRLHGASRHVEAANLWLAKRPAPLNPRDVFTFAEILADSARDEARPFIALARAESPGDAAILDALLATQQQRTADAAASLLAGFAAYRHDAWPLLRIQLRGYSLVDDFGKRDAVVAQQLAAAIGAAPFPGYLLEEARRDTLVRLALGQWRAGQTVKTDPFDLVEPWTAWRGDELKMRFAFYRATGHAGTERARRDLAAFLSAEAPPFDHGLKAAVR